MAGKRLDFACADCDCSQRAGITCWQCGTDLRAPDAVTPDQWGEDDG